MFLAFFGLEIKIVLGLGPRYVGNGYVDGAETYDCRNEVGLGRFWVCAVWGLRVAIGAAGVVP